MRAFIVSVVMAGAVLGAACGGPEPKPAIPARFQTLAQEVEKARADLEVPGVAVAVIEKGEVSFAHGFGVKVRGGADPVKPETLFAIGSLTKALTAVAALQSADPGDPVVKYVPGFHFDRSPGATGQITLRHLLTHTSGIPDYDEISPPESELNDAALEGFLTGRYAGIGYLASPPGAVWAYANPNFMLAGLVAQEASGIPYRQLMRERVFQPLGMRRTSFLPSDVLADGDYAVGWNCAPDDASCFYAGAPETIQPDTYLNFWSDPCGGAWSSVLNLARFARFLLHGQPEVLSDRLRSDMQAAQVSTQTAGEFSSYGYGLFRQPGLVLSVAGEQAFYAMPLVQHGGDLPGYATTFWCLPEQDLCLVALANHSLSHFDQAFAEALPSLVDLPAKQPVPDLEPDPALFPAYAGTYEDATVGDVAITLEDGKLLISIPALDAEGVPYDPELQPVSIDSFVMTAGGQSEFLTFIREGDVYRYLRCRPYLGIRKDS